MKLNTKRTILVGFAFFLICTFWQAYDSIIPLILTNKFGMNQGWSGIIMAIDNILALFMLPLFGSLSDKTKHKMGRRTPFIVVGTVIAVLAFISLSMWDHVQLQKISEYAAIDDVAALEAIYDAQADAVLLTPEGEEFVLCDTFTREEFSAILSKTADGANNPDYTNYVTPARQACALAVTAEDPSALIFFIAFLLLALVAMATFRSPAVALMPDVTIKPLRSKANAIINLMGTAGGILVLVLGIVFSTGAAKNALMDYRVYFAVVASVMAGALAVFLLTVKEPKWAAEMQEESVRLGLEEATTEDTSEKRSLDKQQRRSLLFILASIVLWFFGYNAITSKYSVYAANVLMKDYNTTLLLAQAAAIVAYIPVGMIASKVGRKKTILIGIAMLTVAFGGASFIRADSPVWVMNLLFMLAGVAWASINVNSFPMVVEMCSGSDVGKYTGFYYTASMAAQTLTPMVSGFLMTRFGMTVLFPYGAIFVALAFVTMLNVRHGDSKVEAKKGLEAFDTDD